MPLHAIAPAEQSIADARRVAVFMHGYGSHERDLVSLASVLPAGLPWVSLRAPVPLPHGGYAWFPITEPGNPDPGALAEATRLIWAWADSELPEGTALIPVGFSQGGLMASQLLRTAPDRVVAPVILGGFVSGDEQPGDAHLRALRPAVFSGRGADDRVIVESAVHRTSAWLAEHTEAVERVYPGLAHGIDTAEIADVRAFLAARL